MEPHALALIINDTNSNSRTLIREVLSRSYTPLDLDLEHRTREIPIGVTARSKRWPVLGWSKCDKVQRFRKHGTNGWRTTNQICAYMRTK